MKVTYEVVHWSLGSPIVMQSAIKLSNRLKQASDMPSARTNLGPLTTQWKYPDRCTVPVIGCSACDGGWQAQTCGDNDANTQGVLDDTDCWPPRQTSMKAGNAVNGWGFYSPAFECPKGYSTACSATGPETGNFNFQFSIQDDERVIGCCPSGYTCASPGGPQTCSTIISRGSLQVASCSTKETVLNWMTLPATVTEDTSTATIDGITIYAPMFQLNWRDKDLSLSSGSTRSATTVSVPEETGTSSSSSDGSSSGGLSTGAQAGIGVGVGVVGLAIIGAAFYLWRRRKRATPVAELETKGDQKAAEPVLTHGSPPPQYPPAELDATSSRHEM
ncbi:hypothetical protein FBEOM_8634 [Fusarium beomiforme]|uniref:Uncharacterized protein n=1 Tax=Fusarium beomiforme TaxID=44412 RepID=A0A9P5AFV5_9HYPO|nr:hypothetical protein FBEOM_8634 [Fusarium beomiforme]